MRTYTFLTLTAVGIVTLTNGQNPFTNILGKLELNMKPLKEKFQTASNQIQSASTRCSRPWKDPIKQSVERFRSLVNRKDSNAGLDLDAGLDHLDAGLDLARDAVKLTSSTLSCFAQELSSHTSNEAGVKQHKEKTVKNDSIKNDSFRAKFESKSDRVKGKKKEVSTKKAKDDVKENETEKIRGRYAVPDDDDYSSTNAAYSSSTKLWEAASEKDYNDASRMGYIYYGDQAEAASAWEAASEDSVIEEEPAAEDSWGATKAEDTSKENPFIAEDLDTNKVMEMLASKVGHPNWGERKRAVSDILEILSGGGRDALASVNLQIPNASPWLRRHVPGALVSVAEGVFGTAHPVVQTHVLRTLARYAQKDNNKALDVTLPFFAWSKSSNVRQAALAAITKIANPSNPRAVSVLVHALADNSTTIRRIAQDALDALTDETDEGKIAAKLVLANTASYLGQDPHLRRLWNRVSIRLSEGRQALEELDQEGKEASCGAGGDVQALKDQRDAAIKERDAAIADRDIFEKFMNEYRTQAEKLQGELAAKQHGQRQGKTMLSKKKRRISSSSNARRVQKRLFRPRPDVFQMVKACNVEHQADTQAGELLERCRRRLKHYVRISARASNTTNDANCTQGHGTSEAPAWTVWHGTFMFCVGSMLLFTVGVANDAMKLGSKNEEDLNQNARPSWPPVPEVFQRETSKGAIRTIRIEAPGCDVSQNSTVSGAVEEFKNGVRISLRKKADVPEGACFLTDKHEFSTAVEACPELAWTWIYEPPEGRWHLMDWTFRHGVLLVHLEGQRTQRISFGASERTEHFAFDDEGASESTPEVAEASDAAALAAEVATEQVVEAVESAGSEQHEKEAEAKQEERPLPDIVQEATGALSDDKAGTSEQPDDEQPDEEEDEEEEEEEEEAEEEEEEAMLVENESNISLPEENEDQLPPSPQSSGWDDLGEHCDKGDEEEWLDLQSAFEIK